MSIDARWQVSGDAAGSYEQYVGLLMKPWVHAVVEAAALRRGERILDVACGTGFVARMAAEPVGSEGRVVGIDLNASMIEVARKATKRSAAPIEWRVGDAASLPFESGSFDVAICQQGLQFFPDRGQALREMHRVLRPAGRMILSLWGAIADVPYQAALADALARYVSAEAGAMARVPCALHDGTEVQRMVSTAGFHDVRARLEVKTTELPMPEEFVPGHLSALPIASAVAALLPDQRRALVNDMAAALEPYVRDKHLEIPAAVHVVSAIA